MKRSVVLLVMVSFVVCVGNLLAMRVEEEAEQNLSIARQYLDRGNALRAQEFATKVLAAFPGNPDAKEILEQARRLSTGSYGAGASLEGASEEVLLQTWHSGESDVERKKAGARLSEIYFEQAQSFQKRRGKVAEVLLALRKACLANPENPWAHYELFKQLHRLQRFEESLPFANRFLELQGLGAVAMEVRRKLVEVQMRIGDRYVKQSRWHKAAKHFRAVLGLDPDRVMGKDARQKLALANLTLFFQLQNKKVYTDAAVYLDALIQLRPQDSEERIEFDANYYRKVKRYAPSVFWEAAQAFHTKGKVDDADHFAKRTLESGPSTVIRDKAKQLRETIREQRVEVETAATIGATVDMAPFSPAPVVEPESGGVPRPPGFDPSTDEE